MRTVDSALRETALALEADLPALVDRIMQRIREEVPEYDVAGRPELAQALRAGCLAGAQLALGALRSDRDPARPLERALVAEARSLARTRVPLEALLRSYRVGHAVIWEGVLDALEADDLDASTRRAALRVANRFLFTLFDAEIAAVAAEFTAEREAGLRRSGERRVRLLRDLLDGAPIDETELGVRFARTHVGAASAGEGAYAALEEITRLAGGGALIVQPEADRVWAWLPALPPRDAIEAGLRVVGAARLPAPGAGAGDGGGSVGAAGRLSRVPGAGSAGGAIVAFGDPLPGLDGFRATHRQAVTALDVGMRLGRAMTRFDDVTVEALALADEAAARALLARELGPLAAPTRRAEVLCATLEAYLGRAMSASAAAAVLGVRDRTISYRLRSVEDQLGRPVRDRATELGVALRLRRLLTAAPDAAPAPRRAPTSSRRR